MQTKQIFSSLSFKGCSSQMPLSYHTNIGLDKGDKLQSRASVVCYPIIVRVFQLNVRWEKSCFLFVRCVTLGLIGISIVILGNNDMINKNLEPTRHILDLWCEVYREIV